MSNRIDDPNDDLRKVNPRLNQDRLERQNQASSAVNYLVLIGILLLIAIGVYFYLSSSTVQNPNVAVVPVQQTMPSTNNEAPNSINAPVNNNTNAPTNPNAATPAGSNTGTVNNQPQ